MKERMDEHRIRHPAAKQNRMRDRDRSLRSRPDRVALWAFVMALVMMAFAAASADGQTNGGVSAGEEGTTNEGECLDDAGFGTRPMALGDCGDDVRTLNWLLRSMPFARDGVKLGPRFQGPTETTVRRFERRQGLPVNGVVRKRTRRALVRNMSRERATWYGPGFWGNRTACGQRLRKGTVGVAHRTLPCGTPVVIRYKGRFLRTRVIDRGPYAHGANWDLTQRAARQVNFTHTDAIRVARSR
jgi:hypothetical protein